MPGLRLMLLASVLVIAACGGSAPAPTGPTVGSIAVQASDLPSGMTRCNLTGSIDDFISKEQSPDPQQSKTMSDDWVETRKAGATAAYVALYTDSSAHCDAIKSSGASLGAATFKLVINFVVMYRDEKSATTAYGASQPILGFNPSELRVGPGGGSVEGTKTGLSDNSIALTQAVGDQLFYIAIWQNKGFVVILAVLNIEASASKSVAVRENSRIK